ncbi:uncharacterized protein LOC141702683 [Apium graveolens]|uniref:uncharacterized protein LOC141680304 n=1 Tax=Apium graveolens TaxID=4045 RepID=UPI003D7A91C8
MGRIAALNRFVSKSSYRCKEFFKAIKEMGKDFMWTSDCEEAFQKIKEQLGNPPMLAKPEDGETLILYLAVSGYSISVALVKEAERRQSPVYYVSKRLLDAKTRYTSMEKLVVNQWFENISGSGGCELDSELVVNQVNRGFQARGPGIELYMRCVQRLLEKFGSASLEGVPREKNSNADALAKMGLQMDNIQLGQIPLRIQEILSIPEVRVFQTHEIPHENWMTPIHNYIRMGILLEDKLQARCIRYQAMKYVEYDGVLYERGFNQPLLRCVGLKEGNYILREVGYLWQSLGGWFGILYKLISDNGKQFDSKELRKLCEDLNIKKDFTTVYHPQSNGQTEAINKIIKHTLKAKLEEKKGD